MRRNRENDRIFWAKRQHIIAEMDGIGAAHGKTDGPQPVLEMDLGTMLGKIIECRVNEGRRQALPRHQGTASPPSPRQRFPNHGAGEFRRSFTRIRIQGGEEKRPPEPLVKHTALGKHLTDRRVLAGEKKAQQAKIIQRTLCRAPAGWARKSTTETLRRSDATAIAPRLQGP